MKFYHYVLICISVMANVLANGTCFPLLIDHRVFGEIHVQILLPIFFHLGFLLCFTIMELWEFFCKSSLDLFIYLTVLSLSCSVRDPFGCVMWNVFSCSMRSPSWYAGSWIWRMRLNCGLLHWECWVLGTGPAGDVPLHILETLSSSDNDFTHSVRLSLHFLDGVLWSTEVLIVDSVSNFFFSYLSFYIVSKA